MKLKAIRKSGRQAYSKGWSTAFAMMAGMALLPAMSTPASAQSISDASFETPVQGTGNFTYNPGGTAWTFSSSSGISGNGSSFTSGNPSAPDGVQVGFLQALGSFSQSVTLSTTGLYNVSFLAAQRGSGGNSPNQETFTVSLGGTSLGTFLPSGSSYTNFTTAPIFLTAGTYSLLFAGTNIFGGDNSALIDKVQILSASGAAPEPGSAALLVMGVAPVVAGLIRRRRALRV